MLVKGTANYQIGGWPAPTYRGEIEATVNVDEEDDEFTIHETVVTRLKQKVREKYGGGLGAPHLTNLDIQVER